MCGKPCAALTEAKLPSVQICEAYEARAGSSPVNPTNKPRKRFFLYLSATQKNKLEPATSVEAEKPDNCLNGSYRGALNSRQRRANALAGAVDKRFVFANGDD